MSRQQDWQWKQRQLGRCATCGQRPVIRNCHDEPGYGCIECNQKKAAAKRAQTGDKPWKPGSRGHRPYGSRERTA